MSVSQSVFTLTMPKKPLVGGGAYHYKMCHIYGTTIPNNVDMHKLYKSLC